MLRRRYVLEFLHISKARHLEFLLTCKHDGLKLILCQWANATAGQVLLNAGDNTISIANNWFVLKPIYTLCRASANHC